jgi:enoyl-CoA hydratase/carnithine racemase
MRKKIGITMTLPMTIRLAWQGAKVGFVFSQRGVVMEAASSFFLPRLIGHSRALYLTTTGSTLPASSRHFGDLFHELLPSPQEVFPRALELAEQIVAQTSTVSTYLMREMMWRNPGSAEGAHLLDSELMWELYDKEDKKEGIKAFLEKRSPIMKGNLKDGMPRNVPWWESRDTRPRSGDRNAKSRL